MATPERSYSKPGRKLKGNSSKKQMKVAEQSNHVEEPKDMYAQSTVQAYNTQSTAATMEEPPKKASADEKEKYMTQITHLSDLLCS